MFSENSVVDVVMPGSVFDSWPQVPQGTSSALRAAAWKSQEL